MANKSLFASLTSRLPRANAVNEAGGLAYKLEPKHALAQVAAIGRCPGNHDRLDTVGWAFDARDSCCEDGLELTGIEMPPLAFLTVVVTGELLLAIRATKLRSSRMFHPDPDLLRFHVKFHLRHAPRRLEAKNMLVEFFVLHLRGSFPL